MEHVATWLSWISDAVFALLAIVTARQWWRRRDAASLWLLGTFGSLAVVAIVALVLPQHPHADAELVAARAEIVLISLFPYLLFRFATAFGTPPRERWQRVALLATVAVMVWAVALPSVPEPGDDQPAWFVAFVTAFLVQWSFLLLAVAVRLWRAGRGQGSTTRRRMRSLAGASTMMAAAIIAAGAGSPSGHTHVVDVVTDALALASALAFYAAFAPPRLLRAAWRAPDLERVRAATFELVGITEVAEIEAGFLPKVARLVGADAVALVRTDGAVIGSVGIHRDAVGQRDTTGSTAPTRMSFPFGQLIVWAGPYTPFFGQDELNILRSLGSIVDLALERCQLIANQRETADHLVRVNQLKNEFVAIVAHDLRSPMTVISGFAKTMRNQWDVLDDDRKLLMLDMISRNTDNLATLVEDVLQVARIESGDFTYQIEPFDLAGLVRQTIDDLRAATPDRYVLSLDLPDGASVVLGDPDRNWQVLTNLLSNAAKFSPDDRPIEVRLALADEGTCVAVHVRDHGIGISDVDQRRVFDKFTRIDPKVGTTPVKGTGLGLYICRSMVEAQGGRITVESEPDRGSTFSFTIPRPPAEAVT